MAANKNILILLLAFAVSTIFAKSCDYSSETSIFATCAMAGNLGTDVANRKPISGYVNISAPADPLSVGPTHVAVYIKGLELKDWARVGLHVHAIGKIAKGCGETGGHYNPRTRNHGSRVSKVRHPGDFGNVRVLRKQIQQEFNVNGLKLSGERSVLGRAIVLHGGTDDLGLGGNPGSLANGNSGPRIACCVIQPRQG